LQDYKGQELAERLYYYIIIILGAISWVWGYYVQDFMIVVYGCGAGVVISLLVSTPRLLYFSITINIRVQMPIFYWIVLVQSANERTTSAAVCATQRNSKR
jgi:Microsomal signal peptidase 12 kDa subunit (SPC12)